MFLEQYWGGPTTYSEQRGHPRLRMRHAPFAVTPEHAGPLADPHARRRRLPGPDPSQDQELWTYLERAAYSMVNTFDEPSARDPGLQLGCLQRSDPGQRPG